MVKIDKIYTRGGDKGKTSLGDGKRLSKNSMRISSIGDVDETNCAIGLALTILNPEEEAAKVLSRVQNDLFDLGADLAIPGADINDGNLRIQKIQVTRLEEDIDSLNENLSTLQSFILPGGAKSAAHIHAARAIVRRAERSLIALAESEAVNQFALQYLNRLSDLLFVLARTKNDFGKSEPLWVPGKNIKK